MRIAICDDEAFFRDSLREQLSVYEQEWRMDFLIYEYSDGKELLETNLTFDLIFMDYQMKFCNGIDTVSQLRKKNNDTKVIFISSYKDVVFESLKVQTFRFLVKPVEQEKLYEALSSVIQELNQIYHIIVKDTVLQKNKAIRESDIIYAQADNIYTDIVISDTTYRYMGTIAALEHELCGEFFFRTHRSFIVNMNFVDSYTKKEILMKNGHRAILSKSRYNDFIDSYFSYLKRKSIGG